VDIHSQMLMLIVIRKSRLGRFKVLGLVINIALLFTVAIINIINIIIFFLLFSLFKIELIDSHHLIQVLLNMYVFFVLSPSPPRISFITEQVAIIHFILLLPTLLLLDSANPAFMLPSFSIPPFLEHQLLVFLDTFIFLVDNVLIITYILRLNYLAHILLLLLIIWFEVAIYFLNYLIIFLNLLYFSIQQLIKPHHL